MSSAETQEQRISRLSVRYALRNGPVLMLVKATGATFNIGDGAQEFYVGHDYLPARRQENNTLLFKAAELPAHGLKRQAKIVSHLRPCERQLKMRRITSAMSTAHRGDTPRHHEQKARYSLIRALPAQKKCPIPAGIEFPDRHVENAALKFGMRPEKNLKLYARIKADFRLGRGFGRISVTPAEGLSHEIRRIQQPDDMLLTICKGLYKFDDATNDIEVLIGFITVSKDYLMRFDRLTPSNFPKLQQSCVI